MRRSGVRISAWARLFASRNIFIEFLLILFAILRGCREISSRSGMWVKVFRVVTVDPLSVRPALQDVPSFSTWTHRSREAVTDSIFGL